MILKSALGEPNFLFSTPDRPLSTPIILLIGLPGSGKSTLAHQLIDTMPRYEVVSTDAIRGQLFGDEAIQGAWVLIWREVQRQLRQAIDQIQHGQKRAVIYDATNVVRRDRRQLLSQLRALGFTHLTGLWLDVPLEVCLKRNEQRDRCVPEAVILRMHRRLSGAPPSLSEGLDCLIRYPDVQPPNSGWDCQNKDQNSTAIASGTPVGTEPTWT